MFFHMATKHVFRSLLSIAFTAVLFTACGEVSAPEPYGPPLLNGFGLFLDNI